MEKPTLALRPATAADVPALVALVNRAYRSSAAGWTTEAHLFNGPRTDEEALHELLQGPGAVILQATDANGQLVGCVYLQVQADRLYVGMLTVAPEAQAQGVGRQLLAAAEDRAQRQGCSHLKMSVLTARAELLAWYARRGYMPTGLVESFPDTIRFQPLQPLTLAVLEKALALAG